MNYSLWILCSILLPILSLRQKPPKLCINCKHFIPDNSNSKYGRCSYFPKRENKINFLVNGIHSDEYYYCSVSRDANEMCGEQAKYYKKKRVSKNIVPKENIQ